jgi:hypothetical protein
VWLSGISRPPPQWPQEIKARILPLSYPVRLANHPRHGQQRSLELPGDRVSIGPVRLNPAVALRAAAIAVGVAVGVWMALQTYLPDCPVRGLGTLALCAARPRFAPGLCVLCGAAAAAVVLFVSIAVRRPASR